MAPKNSFPGGAGLFGRRLSLTNPPHQESIRKDRAKPDAIWFVPSLPASGQGDTSKGRDVEALSPGRDGKALATPRPQPVRRTPFGRGSLLAVLGSVRSRRWQTKEACERPVQGHSPGVGDTGRRPGSA